MEDNSYALFVDNSGSVGGSQNYWNTVKQILELYAKDIAHYFLWNSTCGPSTLKGMEASINKKQGIGGTQPQQVAKKIVENRFRNIILVTDGQVGDHDVKACDGIFESAKLNNKFSIAKSICYIIATFQGGLNMSVTCPFTRDCQSKVFTKQYNEPLKAIAQYTTQDYKILDTLEEITLENFEAKYDLIEGLIIALNMGKTGNIPLKNQIVKAKQRLLKELSKSMGKEMDYSAEMRFHLEKGNFQAAIKIAEIMSKAYLLNDEGTMGLQKKISHLINLCGDLRGKYNLGQIKSNRLATAITASEAQINQALDIRSLSKNLIQCPIVMDDDVPQILVDECAPFLMGVEKCIVDDIASCPLRILNYPDLRAKFKASLSTFTGTKITDRLLKNPFTQNRLLGTIPLGTHQSHVQVGNYTIAKLITGGKILGNLHLYYAVIWYLINEGEIQYLKPIKANATEHLTYRLKNSKSTASLCGLAQFVNTEVYTDVAVWFCASSGYLNQPADRDTFRFHYYNMEPMIKMIEVLGYPLHEGMRAHLNRTKVMLRLLSKFKKMNMNERKEFKALFRGLYQKGIFLSKKELEAISPKFRELQVISPFIPIDSEGEPSYQQIERIRELLPKYCNQLNLDELYYISGLLDAQKSASNIFLDYHLKVPPLPKSQINWCYGLKDYDISQVRYNPRTMRPFYTIKDTTWDQCAKQTFQVSNVQKLFRGCKYLESYVLKYEKMPVYTELLLFFYNRYVQGGRMSTLPYLIQPWTHYLIQIFKEASNGQQIESIVGIIASSTTVARRMYMESY